MAAYPFPLSALEQISPQAYTRFALCFKLHPPSQPEQVAEILKQSLAATATSIPSLKQIVVTAHDSNGRELKGTRQEDFQLLTVKHLLEESWNYDDIRSKGFPPSAFDGNVLHRTGIFADPTSPMPVFLAQANLVPGGLLLGISIYHGAFDGTAITNILRIWAHNSQALQSPDQNEATDAKLSQEAFDKSRLSASATSKKATIEDHPEFMLLPSAPTEIPLVLAKTLSTQVFHFTSSALSSLKEAASPSNASVEQTDYTWVSSNTALSALIWRSVMVATYHNEKPAPDTPSMFASPLNARKRMVPPLPDDLIASAWCFQTSQLPMSSLLSSQHNLADTALVVRKAIDAISAEYIDSLISMIESVPDPALLVPLSFIDVTQSSTILTSWATFPMYDFDWGVQLGGRCERVRTAAAGMFNGMTVILPQLPEDMGGGLEVVMIGEDHELEALRADPIWAKYATWR